MMTKIIPLLSIPLILLCAHAHADIFTCKDSKGRLITSDRLLPECADQTTKVYTNSGTLKQELFGALTPEQRQNEEFEEQHRLRQEQKAQQTQKEILYLTTHYPTEQDIEVARLRELGVVDAKMAEEKKSMAAVQEALLRNRSEQLYATKQKVDLTRFKDEESQLKQSIAQSERLLQRYTAQKININRQFDEAHQRYKEIVLARPVGGNP